MAKQSPVKANDAILRIAPLTPPNRYFAKRDSDGRIELPLLFGNQKYIELRGVERADFKTDDSSREVRLFGDSGWSESIITSSRVTLTIAMLFLRNERMVLEGSDQAFMARYENGYRHIQRSRRNKDFEIYVELLKDVNGGGRQAEFPVYDFAGFNGVVMEYKEQMVGDGVVRATFDIASRGEPVFGRYDTSPLPVSADLYFSSLSEQNYGWQEPIWLDWWGF